MAIFSLPYPSLIARSIGIITIKMDSDDHDNIESNKNLEKQHTNDISDQHQQEEQDQIRQSQAQALAPSQISNIRSYECTFCKRGFSNAQALGGHMNIHRKHKAKLKQSSTSPSTETTAHYQHHHQQQQQLRSISPHKKSLYTTAHKDDQNTPTKPSWPWNVFPCQEHDQEQTNKTTMKQVHQLSLFVERPMNKDDQIDHHQKGLSSSEQQLDLELRLGPEPNKDSSSPTAGTTRKFF